MATLREAGLRELCKQLAKGTPFQQEEAWEELILKGKLPADCRGCVSSCRLADLQESYRFLSQPRAQENARRVHAELASRAEDGRTRICAVNNTYSPQFCIDDFARAPHRTSSPPFPTSPHPMPSVAECSELPRMCPKLK